MVSHQCVFVCGFSNWNSEKMLIHRFHKKMAFPPVCIRIWLFKLQLFVKADPHTSQENGFSPVCVCMCFRKLELSEKAVPQISQENGFSPVCVRT